MKHKKGSPQEQETHLQPMEQKSLSPRRSWKELFTEYALPFAVAAVLFTASILLIPLFKPDNAVPTNDSEDSPQTTTTSARSTFPGETTQTSALSTTTVATSASVQTTSKTKASSPSTSRKKVFTPPALQKNLYLQYGNPYKVSLDGQSWEEITKPKGNGKYQYPSDFYENGEYVYFLNAGDGLWRSKLNNPNNTQQKIINGDIRAYCFGDGLIYYMEFSGSDNIYQVSIYSIKPDGSQKNTH